jgi:hypothetical protein
MWEFQQIWGIIATIKENIMVLKITQVLKIVVWFQDQVEHKELAQLLKVIKSLNFQVFLNVFI